MPSALPALSDFSWKYWDCCYYLACIKHPPEHIQCTKKAQFPLSKNSHAKIRQYTEAGPLTYTLSTLTGKRIQKLKKKKKRKTRWCGEGQARVARGLVFSSSGLFQIGLGQTAVPPGVLLPYVLAAGEVTEMKEKTDPRSFIHSSHSLLQCPTKEGRSVVLPAPGTVIMWKT